MATKNNPGEFDCYGSAAPDEPIFTLRANDPYAPDTVRHWAETYKLNKGIDNARASGRGMGPEPLTSDQQRKYDEALACAEAMEEWKARRLEEATP